MIADLPKGTTDSELLDHQVGVATAISALDSVSAVAPVLTSDDHAIAAFQVVPKEGPTSVSTEQLVVGIRAASPLPGGITLGVAGQTSAGIDVSQKLADALPIYLAVVMGLSLLIMIVVFRSLLVPLVATGGFALSLFATLGGTVAIYQNGWLGGLFGVSNPGPILNFLPTLLAGILFGLAMDYTLFLASGMREAYAHGAPSRTAVVLGFKAGASRGGRGRDHHGLGVRRVHVRGQRDDPAYRLRARVRRPRGRVRGAHGDPAGADAPAGRSAPGGCPAGSTV